MRLYILLIITVVLLACKQLPRQSPLTLKKELRSELKNISGLTSTGNFLWAVADSSQPIIYKLDTAGNIISHMRIKDQTVTSIQAISADDHFMYIGVTGNNNSSTTKERKILIIPILDSERTEAESKDIIFSFPDADTSIINDDNFKCSAMISFGDSLYIFASGDGDITRVYTLPKNPGNYKAVYNNSFKSNGYITDAAIDPANKEIVLLGYQEEHLYPFILIASVNKPGLSFSGDLQRIELADQSWDWKLESITYTGNDRIYFACAQTPQVPATLYGIQHSNLFKLNKSGKQQNDGKDEKSGKDKSHMSLKGHLKP